MPPFLKKQVFGLPAWAWLAITSVALGVGLYARHKSNENKSADSGDPCDSESKSYDPATCNQGSTTNAPSAGYDSGDPCDPSSATYDPTACQAGAGFEPGNGGGAITPYNPGTGAGTGIPGLEAPSTPAEISGAEQGGINITAPLIEQNITEAPKSSSKQQSGCKNTKKPKAKKGFSIECQGGRWHYIPKTHAGNKKKNPTHNMTGGGAPNKKNDKFTTA